MRPILGYGAARSCLRGDGMFHYLQAVSAAAALAIVTASIPALAQYAPPGAPGYAEDRPNPPANGNWMADDDDDDVVAVPLAPRGPQPGQLMPLFMPPPPPFFLPPPPPPFFATPYERRPAAAYEPGLASRGYEQGAPPRPPGGIDGSMQRPYQGPGPATAAPGPVQVQVQRPRTSRRCRRSTRRSKVDRRNWRHSSSASW